MFIFYLNLNNCDTFPPSQSEFGQFDKIRLSSKIRQQKFGLNSIRSKKSEIRIRFEFGFVELKNSTNSGKFGLLIQQLSS